MTAMTKERFETAPIGTEFRYRLNDEEHIYRFVGGSDTYKNRKVERVDTGKPFLFCHHGDRMFEMEKTAMKKTKPRKDNGIRYTIANGGGWYTDLDSAKAAASIGQTIYEIRPLLKTTKKFDKV